MCFGKANRPQLSKQTEIDISKEGRDNTYIDPYSFNLNANPNHYKIFINSVFFVERFASTRIISTLRFTIGFKEPVYSSYKKYSMAVRTHVSDVAEYDFN